MYMQVKLYLLHRHQDSSELAFLCIAQLLSILVADPLSEHGKKPIRMIKSGVNKF